VSVVSQKSDDLLLLYWRKCGPDIGSLVQCFAYLHLLKLFNWANPSVMKFFPRIEVCGADNVNPSWSYLA
ncbi:hypothetical protein A2U01_0099164, partial [Trifolium medium]|nr:hypothetical protein [Trifolium medium]